MTQVWVGVSKALDFEELIVEYIDPYWGPVDKDDGPVGKLELDLGASRIQPGDFEVYDKNPVTGESLVANSVMMQLPFSSELSGLTKVDWRNVRTAFYVVSETKPTKIHDHKVTITDVENIKFEWA